MPASQITTTAERTCSNAVLALSKVLREHFTAPPVPLRIERERRQERVRVAC